MNEDIIDQFNSWGLGPELHEEAYEMAKNYGTELMNEWISYSVIPKDKGYMHKWKKDIEEIILFRATSWLQMHNILEEIFQYSYLNNFDLFDKNDLVKNLRDKRLLFFYDDKIGKNNCEVICCQGSKLSSNQKIFMINGYMIWKNFESDIKNCI